MIRFEVTNTDTETGARRGVLRTAHGEIQTPVFMPVGTLATVKTLTPEDLKRLGVDIILANAYHLHLRPGSELIGRLGGLHRFMSYPGSILTDSGGFQVFSLGDSVKVSEDGVTFASPIDGDKHFFTPESVVGIQKNLGSDIAMPLDHCIRFGAPHDEVAAAMQRTILWAGRSKIESDRLGVSMFGIIQGGTDAGLRRECTARIAELDFSGYAIGGLSVGEGPELMQEILAVTTELMPDDKPRYLMGVGTPGDMLGAMAKGIDMFDCVIPTRNARNGQALTSQGPVNMKNARHRSDEAPLDNNCECMVCRQFSRAYLRHLVMSREILGLRLLTYHNVYFYLDLMDRARRAIEQGIFVAFCRDTLKHYETGE